MEWQPIETCPKGQHVLLWEPMYGWLLGALDSRYGFQIKSTGNYWHEVPPGVTFTHWSEVLPSPGTESPTKVEMSDDYLEHGIRFFRE